MLCHSVEGRFAFACDKRKTSRKHAKLLFINENEKERKTLCCSMMSKIKKGSASVLKYERK